MKTSNEEPGTLSYADPTTRPAAAAAAPPRPPRRWAWAGASVLVVLAAFAVGVLSSGRVHQLFHGHGHGHADAAPAGGGKQLWTCGMHPQVIQDKPGLCPICHMDLTPLSAASSGGGMGGSAVQIDPVVVQNMGVRVQPVAVGPLRQQVRVVGYLEEPEPLHRDINLRVSGWIEKLHANIDGMIVRKGDPLFELYSPDVLVAVESLIAARRARGAEGGAGAGGDDLSHETTQTLYESTRQKLLLWGLSEKQVDDLAKLDRAPGTVTFLSPMDGHVTEKSVYEGASVQAGQRALRIANRNPMWIDAQVYERQYPLIKTGLKAQAIVAGLTGRTFEAEVGFIHPHIDPVTRTALVRIVVPNDDLILRQGMYATVEIAVPSVERAVTVPREAVIDTGTRQVAFVALGEGRFEPRDVKLGLVGQDGAVQVLEGLAAGEQVVTSGQFLIDSESRLKEAIAKHLSGGLAKADAPQQPAAGQAVAAPQKPAKPLKDGPEVRAALDRTAGAYLKVAATLGAPQKDAGAPPVAVDELTAAAKALAEADGGEDTAALAGAAEAMAGKAVAEQRGLFAPLSHAMIAMVEANPPSAAVAAKLYVANCPMAFNDQGADWLQASETIANPYFDKTMKRCGVIKRPLPTAAAGAPPAPRGTEARPKAAAPATRPAPAARPAGAGAGKLPWSADVDALFVPYLEMAAALGAARPPQGPLDVGKLVGAARALVDVTPAESQAHARKVLTAASALKGAPPDKQRALFAPLSEAMIAMAEVCPPSTAVAKELYVMTCPMKKAQWLQTTDRLANPYYATEMKRCGEALRTIDAVAAR